MIMNIEDIKRNKEVKIKNKHSGSFHNFESSERSYASCEKFSDPSSCSSSGADVSSPVPKDFEYEKTVDTASTGDSYQPTEKTVPQCRNDSVESTEQEPNNILLQSLMFINNGKFDMKNKITGDLTLFEISENLYTNCENFSTSSNSITSDCCIALEESIDTQTITDSNLQLENNEAKCGNGTSQLSSMNKTPNSDHHTTLQSRQNSVQTGETDFEEDSFYNATETGSNTESFSELRFSISETHSEFNYSDSDNDISPEITMLKKTDEFNLLEQFPDICNYQAKRFDDTSGILYEMSEHLNKVPKLLSEFNKQSSIPERVDSLKLEVEACPDLKNDTGDTLEDRVLQYFSQCDKLPLSWKENSKGQEELEKLEAAVERMLTQVEIQENLLKEDIDFVPLVLDKKEVKALPILVDTLCISPQVQRRQIHIVPSFQRGESKLTSSEYKNSVFPVPQTFESSSFTEKMRPSIEKGVMTCSINDLEKSVNRLLNEVEKEEEKLRMSSPDSRKTYTSTTSTTDVSSEDDSFGVWWEGAYRSLPRHSARKRLTKSSICSQKLLKPPQKPLWSQSQTSDDSDTSKESVRLSEKCKKPQTKLMVRTTDSGKSALEIRTCNDFENCTKEEGGSKFCRMFSRTQSEAHSIWNRSLPSLRHSPPLFPSIIPRSLGSDDSINYVKYMEPADCIQYFTPCPTMDLDSTGYCTWSQKCSGGKALIDFA